MDKIDKLVSLILPELENLEVIHKKNDDGTISMGLKKPSGNIIAVLNNQNYVIPQFRIYTPNIENMDTIINILDIKDRLDFSGQIAHVLLSKLLDNYDRMEIAGMTPNQFVSYNIFSNEEDR